MRPVHSAQEAVGPGACRDATGQGNLRRRGGRPPARHDPGSASRRPQPARTGRRPDGRPCRLINADGRVRVRWGQEKHPQGVDSAESGAGLVAERPPAAETETACPFPHRVRDRPRRGHFGPENETAHMADPQPAAHLPLPPHDPRHPNPGGHPVRLQAVCRLAANERLRGTCAKGHRPLRPHHRRLADDDSGTHHRRRSAPVPHLVCDGRHCGRQVRHLGAGGQPDRDAAGCRSAAHRFGAGSRTVRLAGRHVLPAGETDGPRSDGR